MGRGDKSMPDEQDEVVRSLVELLALVKAGMPDYLFAIDPCVQRARQLIATRSQVSSSRPPSIVALPSTMVDQGPPPTIEDVERMPGAEAPWDIAAGLDAFMLSGRAPPTRAEAVSVIMRDWLVGHGYIEPPPEHGH